MLNQIKRLDILAPDIFEQCIDYQGAGKWIAIYFEPEINQTICSDGKTVIAASSDIWSVLLSPLSTSSQFQELGLESQKCLLLDRSSRVFYVAEQTTAQRLLQQPYCLDLYCSLNSKSDGKQPVEIALVKEKSRTKLLHTPPDRSSSSVTPNVIKAVAATAAGFAVMLLAGSRLPKVNVPVNATNQYKSALVQVAFNPSKENISGAVKTAFNPELPYAEALILNQNKILASSQKELHLAFELLGSLFEVCILLSIAKCILAESRNMGDWQTPAFRLLALQLCLFYVNLLTALAVFSSGVAVIYFLVTASSSLAWLSFDSIESLVRQSVFSDHRFYSRLSSVLCRDKKA